MSRKEFIDKLTAQLKKWDTEIEKLETNAKSASAELKADYNQQIQELRSKKATARDKLGEVKRASEEAWKELRSGAEKAFDEMKNTFDRVVAKFK